MGAGDTIELVAAHLHEQGLGRLIVANRSIDRAQQLAGRYHGYAIGLADVGAHLADADIVVAATASRLPVLGKGAVETALQARRHRPMFLVDLAVPRNMEVEIGALDDVYLYTVDDLHDVIDGNLRQREVAAVQAGEIVLAQTKHFLDWLRASDAVKTVTELRARAERTKALILESAERQLAAGADPRVVLGTAATKLVNKLMHEPSVRLREAATEGRSEILDAAIELFDLGTDSGR
jgi:glutamyl-tRNA reductase